MVGGVGCGYGGRGEEVVMVGGGRRLLWRVAGCYGGEQVVKVGGDRMVCMSGTREVRYFSD